MPLLTNFHFFKNYWRVLFHVNFLLLRTSCTKTLQIHANNRRLRACMRYCVIIVKVRDKSNH